jgi:hypothetical protein
VTHQLRTPSTSRGTWLSASRTAHRDRPGSTEKVDESEFIMLKDGLISFEGNAEQQHSTDPYLKTFLSFAAGGWWLVRIGD